VTADATASDKHPPTVVERYRRHLDSPYGKDLYPLAEVEILACELRDLVALAERATLYQQASEAQARESLTEDGVVPLRQRPIPEQIDYLTDKLAAQLDGSKLPREILIAIGAAIVTMGAIAAKLRQEAPDV
jgi:hypothetical protein